MKPDSNRLLKWELTRERFGIEDRFPSPLPRPEKCIGDILKKITDEEVVQNEPLPKVLMDGWASAAGPHLAKHTFPVHIKNDVLYVYADHPGWLSELKRLPKTRLIKRICSIQLQIKDIRFQIDPAIRTKKGRSFSARRNSANQDTKT